MKPRNILHCQLTKALFIPGYKELSQRTLNQQFHPGIKMALHPLGAFVTFANGLECIVPSQMIEVIVLEAQDATKA
jgi:hypothetical protein